MNIIISSFRSINQKTIESNTVAIKTHVEQHEHHEYQSKLTQDPTKAFNRNQDINLYIVPLFWQNIEDAAGKITEY